jgi:hypothetical protein
MARRDLCPLRHEVEVADGQAAREQPEHRRQPAATRQVDRLVELVVPVHLALRIVRGDERLVHVAESDQLLFREPGCGPTRSQPGDQPEDPVVVDDVRPLEERDERAAPRHRVDEALLRELDERFPHRQAAHPERLADLVLVDLRARNQLAGQDLLAEVRRRGVLEGAGRASAHHTLDEVDLTHLPLSNSS